MLFDLNEKYIAMITRIVTVKLLLSSIDLPVPVTSLAKRLLRSPSASDLCRNRTLLKRLPTSGPISFRGEREEPPAILQKGLRRHPVLAHVDSVLEQVDGCVLIGEGVVQLLVAVDQFLLALARILALK